MTDRYFFCLAFSNAMENSPVGCGARFCWGWGCAVCLSLGLRAALGLASGRA